MRAFFLTALLVLIAVWQLDSQEVFATQSWELSLDKQQDGWVDSGDRILVSTEISTYDSLSNDLTFRNLKESLFLFLVPNTVKSSHGNITVGGNTKDSTVVVESISLKTIGEKAIISFEYEVDFSFNQDEHINIQNHASIISGDQEVASNNIEIPIKGQSRTSDSLFILISKYGLLGLAGLIFILFIVNFRSKSANINLASNP